MGQSDFNGLGGGKVTPSCEIDSGQQIYWKALWTLEQDREDADIRWLAGALAQPYP